MLKPTTLLVLGAVLLGLLLRVNDLGRPGFETDEGHSAWLAAQPLTEMPELLRRDSAPPLYYFLLHFWQRFFPSDAGLRWLSVLLGVAAIPLMYLIGRRLLGAAGGVVAAWFLAASSFHVRYSQIAKNNALLFLVSEAALLALLAACRRPERRLPWAGLAAAVAALLYAHGVAPFVVAGLGVVFFIQTGRGFKDRLRPWVAAHLAAAVLFLPWAGVALHQASEVSQLFWAKKPGPMMPAYTFARFLLLRPAAPALPLGEIPGIGSDLKGFPFAGALLSALPGRIWWILPGLAAGASALLLAVAGRWRLLLVLGALFAVPVGGVWLVSQAVASIYLHRVLIGSLIPIPILLASPFIFTGRSGGGREGQEGRLRGWPAWTAAGLSAIVFPMLLFATWYSTEVRKTMGWREATAHVLEAAGPGDALVFDAHFGQLLFDRYLGGERERFPRYGLPSGWYEGGTPTVARYVRSEEDLGPLREAARRHGVLWLVQSHTALHDPGRLALAWCRAHLRETGGEGFLAVDLRRFEAPEEPPPAPEEGG